MDKSRKQNRHGQINKIEQTDKSTKQVRDKQINKIEPRQTNQEKES